MSDVKNEESNIKSIKTDPTDIKAIAVGPMYSVSSSIFPVPVSGKLMFIFKSDKIILVNQLLFFLIIFTIEIT